MSAKMPDFASECALILASSEARSENLKCPARDFRAESLSKEALRRERRHMQRRVLSPKSGVGRLHLHRAAALLAHAQDSIRKARPELKRVTIAGDFRRGCELVGDLAIVAEAAKPDKTSTPLADGLQIRVSDRKHFGAALLFATGSAEHIEQLRTLAAEKEMRLEADGLHKGRILIAGDEAGIYRLASGQAAFRQGPRTVTRLVLQIPLSAPLRRYVAALHARGTTAFPLPHGR